MQLYKTANREWRRETTREGEAVPNFTEFNDKLERDYQYIK